MLRLAGTKLKEIDDEWLGGRRCFSSESLVQLTEPDVAETLAPAPPDMSPVK
ncbi:MAG: hypothetical protein ACK2UL_02620 [Anaerolineae bacterium]